MTSTMFSMAGGPDMTQSASRRNASNILILQNLVAVWRERHDSRLTLRRLDDHMLADIGMSRLDAEIEIAKPFWRR